MVWASGVLWLLYHYFLQSEGDFGPKPHMLEIWWLRLHGLAAMLALAVVGSLATNHMRLAMSLKKNLASGLGMLALVIWLTATGYALYYFPGDENAWLPLLHWFAGLVLPALLMIHILAGRARMPRVRAQPRQALKLRVADIHPIPSRANHKANP